MNDINYCNRFSEKVITANKQIPGPAIRVSYDYFLFGFSKFILQKYKRIEVNIY